MRFLKWLLLDVWTPMNIRFGIVYSFFAQFKFLLELMVLVGAGYYLVLGKVPSRKLLAVIFIILFVIAVGIGEILIRFNIPQKMNEKANKINPQISAIDEILEKVRKL